MGIRRYVLHRGEERGCLGSHWIQQHDPESLREIDGAIAFDRAGMHDVITHQSYGRTCSGAFAASLASALDRLNPEFGYAPDNSGLYTDTSEYAGSCLNAPTCRSVIMASMVRKKRSTSAIANSCLPPCSSLVRPG